VNGLPVMLARLLEPPAVPGNEEPVATLIETEMTQRGLVVQRDAIGNVWTTLGAGRPHVLLLAHTDEVGFTVSGIAPDGTVFLQPLGHWELEPLAGLPVDIHTDSGTISGVIVKPSPHLRQIDVQTTSKSTLRVDLGVDSASEVAKLGVALLDPVVLTRYQLLLGESLYTARGLDNRLGCYLLAEVARTVTNDGPEEGTVTLAWCAQEEVGFRGPLALKTRFEDPFDAVIAVDAYPGSRGPVSAARETVRLGAGPVLRQADLAGIASNALAERIQRVAAKVNVPLQRGYAQGHTQASVFHDSPTVALDFAAAYLHSQVESVHKKDVAWLRALLLAIASAPTEVSTS
jgi:putative aminopeptidase FrvX